MSSTVLSSRLNTVTADGSDVIQGGRLFQTRSKARSLIVATRSWYNELVRRR